MPRPKGSLNKKTKPVQLEFEEKPKTSIEVPMTTDILEEVETELDIARMELEKVKREIEEKKLEIKYMPMREVDAEEMVIVKKQQAGFVKNSALKEKIEKQKAFDDIPTTGRFMNRRSPGNHVKLTYMKYETDPVKWYTFDDGKVYTIPRGFVDQIKEYYYKPQFVQKITIMDPNRPESAIQDIDTSNKLYDFVPVNF